MPRSKKEENPERLKAARSIYAEAQEAKATGDLQTMAAKLNELGDLLTAPEPAKPLKDVPNVSAVAAIEWDEPHTLAAIALAEGKTQAEAGEEVGVTGRTIRNWLQNQEFTAEVDRLSLMLGIASRAERLRLAKRVIRQKTLGSTVKTDKDLLDWIKFAQSETDGVKLDLGKLAALGETETPVADSGSDRTSNPAESQSVN